MKEKMDSNELADKFLSFEKRHDLFELKTSDNLYLWDIVRYYLYIRILMEKGEYRIPEISVKSRNPLKMLKTLFRTLLNEFYFFFKARQHKVLFFMNSRNTGDDGNPYDIVLSDFLNEVSDFYIIESNNNRNFKFPSMFDQRYFLFWVNFQNRVPNKDSSRDEFQALSNLINNEFEMEYSWGNFITEMIDKYQIELKVFGRVMDRIKPALLIFISNNLPKSLIAAAKNRGIHTVEVQHGSITSSSINVRYDPAIDYSKISTIHDAIFTFSDYWHSRISDVFKKITTGNSSFYQSQIEDSIQKNSFTFVSGKFVFSFLFDFALKTATLNPNINFFYKLHSAEIDHWEYAKEKSKDLENLQVVYNERSIDDLYKVSDGLILIQSTCSYEALQKGLHIYIIKEYYYNESIDLFDIANVHFLRSPEEFNGKQVSEENKRRPVPEFFSPFNSKNFQSYIKNYS